MSSNAVQGSNFSFGGPFLAFLALARLQPPKNFFSRVRHVSAVAQSSFKLVFSDAIRVTGATGHSYHLFRLHLELEGCVAVYFCRTQVRDALVSSGDTRLRSAADAVCAEEANVEAGGNGPLDYEWENVDGDAQLPPWRAQPVVVVDNAALGLLKSAGIVGKGVNLANQTQLWSVRHAESVLQRLGEQPDTVQAFMDAACQPRGAGVSAATFVAIGGTGPLSNVVQLPPMLPNTLNLRPGSESGTFGLAVAELAPAWAPVAGHFKEPINLDRAGSPLQPATVNKTLESVRRVLGFAYNVMLDSSVALQAAAAAGGGGSAANPSPGSSSTRYALAALADGRMLAAYTRWCLEVRNKSPASITSELGDVIRVLRFLATRAHSLEAAEMLQLAGTLGRLIRQLAALPTAARPTVEELTLAGKYVDLAEVWLYIDGLFDALDFADRSPANARRVHDVLMLHVCLRGSPVKRPGCMGVIKSPGLQISTCGWQGCTAVGCTGNSWTRRAADGAWILTLVHFKTAGVHGGHEAQVIHFLTACNTGVLLGAYTDWARELLVKEPTSDMWLTGAGRAFKSEGTFNDYMPRLLLPVLKGGCTWTALRHLVATSIAPLVDGPDQLGGLALAMQTSVRKLEEVYNYSKRQLALDAGNALYAALGGRRAAAASPAQPAAGAPPPPLAEGWDADPPPAAGEEEEEEELEKEEEADAGQQLALAPVAPVFDDFLIGCRPRPAPRPAGPLRRQGAPDRYAKLPSSRYFSEDEVARCFKQGGARALRNMFKYVYGADTATTNLRWLRRKLIKPPL
jgi:hypothetical protein